MQENWGISVEMSGQNPSSHLAADRRDLVQVMDAVAAGDRKALSVLYGRTSAKLYGICLRVLNSEVEAQDVLQEVYLTVWRKASRFDPAKASPITWLAVLARNRAIDQLRRRGPASEILMSAANVPDHSDSACDVIEADQERARLNECLDELDQRAAAMIRSAFLDGTTYPELAKREDVPLGTMKSWIRRGLKRLKGCLER